mmetsp:Transcript_16233/g.24468  ORF Transcript_16233/g.24468 Transcript_16233/m.24468 type:complete len:516 (-) Transcript_16233:146-1693(-)
MQNLSAALPPSSAQPEARLTPDGLYRIDLTEMGLLGTGAHGVVRIAQNINTGEYVAVKIMPTSVLRTACKEVMALTRLSHTHIVQMLSVQVDMLLEHVYVLMELCQGGELFDRIAECGGLEEFEAKRYFCQILLAVHHCHQNKVFHRDLKPENVLLDAEDNAKVADFGLAAVSQHVADDATFLRHTKVGSVMYAAPEVLTSTVAVGYDAAHADMWSLGIILFSMLSGSLPFQCAAASRCKRYAAVLRQGIQVMCPEHLSPMVVSLLSRMLDPDPKRRYTPSEALQCEWFHDSPPPVFSFTGGGSTMKSWTVAMRVQQGGVRPMDASGVAGDEHDPTREDSVVARKRARVVNAEQACVSAQPSGLSSVRVGARGDSAHDTSASCHNCESRDQREAQARRDAGSSRPDAFVQRHEPEFMSTSSLGSPCRQEHPSGSTGPGPGSPMRSCVSDVLPQLGLGPLPHETEQLLQDILQTLHSLGLQYTIKEEVGGGVATLIDDDGSSQEFQRAILKIHFNT